MFIIVPFLMLSVAAAAQPWVEIAAWTPPANERHITPSSKCAALRSLSGYDISVLSATLMRADDGPEYCRVLGHIQPEIKLEVALPTSWHGRFLMIGNGGYAGESLEYIPRTMIRDAAVRSGFLFAQTNTGHDSEVIGEPYYQIRADQLASTPLLGSFATDQQKLLDYAFRAVHVTAETAKRIAEAYYGTRPKRSYFIGCSTGGRQGLISAQRFPADFDGIYSGAPVLDFVSTQVNYVAILRAFARAPLSKEQLKQVGKFVYEHCDAMDGLKDGLIDDPRRCSFDPSVRLPRCTAEQSLGCFTEGQIQSLQALYSDQYIAGERVFPGWPVGAEAEGADGHIGWHQWLVNTEEPPIFAQFAEAFFRFLAEPEKKPNLQLEELDFERKPLNLEPIRQILNATDTDLSAFRDNGGKLLMWFGWSDPALNPLMGVEYYESVLKFMGPETSDFFRLYMIPGLFHCNGGVGCNYAPRLSALIDWVERNNAPEEIVGSQIVSGKVVRTRPLCPYPQVAKYKGTGSVDDAASFACAAP